MSHDFPRKKYSFEYWGQTIDHFRNAKNGGVLKSYNQAKLAPMAQTCAIRDAFCIDVK
jgi:hypothetical protein